MLRKLLITFGLIIAILPYLGFPHHVDDVVDTFLGLLIVFLLFFSRRPRHGASHAPESVPTAPQTLPVDRMNDAHRPSLNVARETMHKQTAVIDTPTEHAVIEEKIMVTRRKRKVDPTRTPAPYESLNSSRRTSIATE